MGKGNQVILGTGIDIIEVKRIEDSIERHGERFLNRVYLPDELAYARSHSLCAVHLAARFAAKEAVSKALGVGIGESMSWTDIEVRNQSNGNPYIELHGKAQEFASKHGVEKILISMSHTRAYGVAHVIITGVAS